MNSDVGFEIPTSYASCSLQPLAGKLYSQFSSKVSSCGPRLFLQVFVILMTSIKYVFITFLALFEAGSLLCGIATSSNILILGRAVAGIGGAGLVNGALIIIAACVPLEKRPGMTYDFRSINVKADVYEVILGVMMSGEAILNSEAKRVMLTLPSWPTWGTSWPPDRRRVNTIHNLAMV